MEAAAFFWREANAACEAACKKVPRAKTATPTNLSRGRDAKAENIREAGCFKEDGGGESEASRA